MEENITVHRKTSSNKLLDGGLHAYRAKKKKQAYPMMKVARHAWVKNHIAWTFEQ